MSKMFTAAFLGAFALVACVAQANPLGNPGFETVPAGGAGDWNAFAASGSSSAHSTSDPRSGTGHMQLITGGPNQFAGVFQFGSVTGLSAGQIVTISGWHKSLLDPFNGDREVKFEWVGAPQLVRVVTGAAAMGTSYSQFSETAVVPAGATGATITYAIATFGPGQGENAVNIDDFAVSVVPEPTTIGLGLLGLAGLGLATRRRR